MKTFASEEALNKWLETQGDFPEPFELTTYTAEPLPIPMLPPWDFRGGQVIAAFPAKRQIRDAKGERVEHLIAILLAGLVLPISVFDPEKGDWTLVGDIPVDSNWVGDYVDWSTESIQPFIDGHPPQVDIAAVFKQMLANLRYFIDLPEELFEFLALWGIGTYFRPVWDAYGYLHFDSSEEACGKTRAGETLGRMCFWPIQMNGASTLPEWRDSSHFGRTQILDDLETAEETLRRQGALSLLHGGYKRGAPVRLKDKSGQGFKSKVVQPFTSRIIASVWNMPPMLRSRTFRIWMKRTANANITHHREWPYPAQAIKDALYTWAYQNMSAVAKEYAGSRVEVLLGRAHEIARPILTIASLVEDAGIKGLFERTQAILEDLDSDNLCDRAEAKDDSALREAVLACNSEEVTAQQVHAQMPLSDLSVDKIGRALAGASWAKKRVVHGRAVYRIDLGGLGGLGRARVD
jgi:hypothetical protein